MQHNLVTWIYWVESSTSSILVSNFTKEDKTLIDGDLKGALGLLDSLEGKLS